MILQEEDLLSIKTIQFDSSFFVFFKSHNQTEDTMRCRKNGHSD